MRKLYGTARRMRGISQHRMSGAMRRNFWVCAAALIIAGAPQLAAQTPEADKAAVLAVVKRLFDGMRAGDSAVVRSVFHPQAVLTTALIRQGNAVLETEPIEGFVKAVGTPHTEVWDERTRNEQVLLDGTLASVWLEYSFFAGTRFSHCGVDAFQLAKDGAEWKIVALADTRRRTGCVE